MVALYRGLYQALGLFSFAFGTVLTFWLGSHGVGILLGMIRRGR